MVSAGNSLNILSKGAGIIFIGFFISKLLGYLLRIIIARNPSLGAEGYGILSLAFAVLGILSLISVCGLNFGLTRFIPQYRVKGDQRNVLRIIISSFKISALFSVPLAILLYTFADYIAVVFFSEPQLAILLRFFAIILPFDVWRGIGLGVFQGFKKVEYDMLTKNLTENIIKVALVIILLHLGFGLVGVGWAFLVASIIGALLASYFIIKLIPRFFRKFLGFKVKWKILSYSAPLMFMAALMFFLGWTDTFMIGYLLKDSVAVGIYNAAMPTAQMMFLFPYSFFILLLPLLTELYIKKENTEFNRIYKLATKWVLFPLSLLLVLFIFFPKEILKVLFGSDFIIGAPVLTIIGIGYFVNFPLRSCEKILMLLKKTKLLFWNTFVIVLLNIILNYFLILKFGITGAALATAISFIVLGLLMLIESYAYIKVLPLNWSALKIVLVAFASAYLVRIVTDYFIVDARFYVWLIIFSIVAIVYLVLLFLTRSVGKEEIMMLSMIQKKTKLRVGFINKIIKKFI